MDMAGKIQLSLSVSDVKDPTKAIITESVELDHADHLSHRHIAQRLNILKPRLPMDSQAKYGIVARGEATIYLRIPSLSEPAYKEKIWDHAAGSIIPKAVTDSWHRGLFHGIKMEKSGVVVTSFSERF
jgi:3'(2'), 5'-bisphosphate nucleotidase